MTNKFQLVSGQVIHEVDNANYCPFWFQGEKFLEKDGIEYEMIDVKYKMKETLWIMQPKK